MSPSLCYWFTSLLIYYSIDHALSQQCISSPPELSWTKSNGVSKASLVFGAKQFTINGVTFTTRVHNGQIPSPTLKLKPGETYELTLVNELGPEVKSTTPNTIKDVNYTNIHTHGVHISGESPADNIFTVIEPGHDPPQSYTYTYHIPCDHSGGTMWYHPHHHGSTTIQVGGGAAGAIIIQDNNNELSSFPHWYTSLTDNELVLVIQRLDLGKIAQLGGGIDTLFKTSDNTAFYTINGQYHPKICLTTGVWTKWRIVHIDIASDVTLTVNHDNCQIYLLAKDGVLIHGRNNETPQLIPSNEMYFTVSSRADIAIQCIQEGTYTLTADGIAIASIEVTGVPETVSELSVFNPFRPGYLESLLSYNGVYNSRSMKMSARTINNEKFSSSTNYQFVIAASSVNEWSINGAGAHPFHAHINHFQLHSFGKIGHPSGWTERGDWIDTLGFNADVRFYADRFGGKVILHCHILEHEDQGAMGVFLIDGGCDGLKGNFGSGACDNTCNDEPDPPTDPPTEPPTEPPSDPPTEPPAAEPCNGNKGSCSSNSDCCSNNCKGGSCKGN